MALRGLLKLAGFVAADCASCVRQLGLFDDHRHPIIHDNGHVFCQAAGAGRADH
jgi:hypothetical protein